MKFTGITHLVLYLHEIATQLTDGIVTYEVVGIDAAEQHGN